MIELRLLGSLELKGSEGKTLRSVRAQPQRVALVAYLAVAKPKGFHRRDKLLGLFDHRHGRQVLLTYADPSTGNTAWVSPG